MLLWTLGVVVSALLSMGAIAFVTLLERKVLGLSQMRLGPNKIVFYGILQPLADGLKLLTKQSLYPKQSQSILYSFFPLILLLVYFSVWVLLVPWFGTSFMMKYSGLAFFCLLGVIAYTAILMGWSATSSFLKLGSLRGILQSLSYEVALMLSFLWIFSLTKELNFMKTSLEAFSIMWAGVWIILVLMEGNRAPFDLLEGESELISGFNIEMGSLLFVYIFLSEYGMILLMSSISSLAIFNNVSVVCTTVFFLTILLLRSCYPRVRYDSLMSMMWKDLLPLCVLFLLPVLVYM